MTLDTKNNKGMSLIEILVVITVFAVLAVISTRAIVLTLKGARKSESQIKVRENVNYALSVIERQLRNSSEVSPCPNPSSLTLDYVSRDKAITSFSCQSVGSGGYIASGSARLTSNEVSIVSCSMTCNLSGGSVPVINISVDAQDANLTDTEASRVTTQTEITLRNY